MGEDVKEINYRTPEQEQAAKGANTPDPYEMSLDDINPLNAHLFADNRWQPVFERLRAEDPVHLNEIETAGRYWSLTKYRDIKDVDADWQRFSSANGITLGFKVGTDVPQSAFSGAKSPFIAQDPPDHDVERKSVTEIVAPRGLVNLEPLIRERTCAVLEGLPEGQEFDWVEEVSIELTTLMLASLFDFPLEDRKKLTRWSDVVFAIPEPGGVVETQQEKREEFIECITYFARLFEQRRRKPGHDLVSMLVQGEATKELEPIEHLGNLLLLIVGGNDTTRNTMSGSVYALNKFPEQYDKLVANPDLVPKMVAEVIRWQTPLSYMRRTAKVDCEVGGKKIKAGDQLLMWYVSGNRDEEVFENADVLEIGRQNARQHLSFGFGIHRCMGNRLAELQLKILWEEILARFEKIEVVEEPSRSFSSFVKGYTHLPVKLRRKT